MIKFTLSDLRVSTILKSQNLAVDRMHSMLKIIKVDPTVLFTKENSELYYIIKRFKNKIMNSKLLEGLFWKRKIGSSKSVR